MQDAHHALPSSLAAATAAADPAAERAAAKRVPWVDKARLVAGIAAFRKTGRVGEELAADLTAIARGVYRKQRPTDDEDDFVQDCYLHLAAGAPLRNVRPDPTALGYLIRCAWSFAVKQRAKAAKQAARVQDLYHAARAVGPAVRRSPGQASKYAALHDADPDPGPAAVTVAYAERFAADADGRDGSGRFH